MGRKRHIYKTSLLKFVLNWLIQIFNGKLDSLSTCCWDDLLLTWIILMRHVVQWLHHIIISPFLLSFFMFPLFFLLSLFSTFSFHCYFLSYICRKAFSRKIIAKTVPSFIQQRFTPFVSPIGDGFTYYVSYSCHSWLLRIFWSFEKMLGLICFPNYIVKSAILYSNISTDQNKFNFK